MWRMLQQIQVAGVDSKAIEQTNQAVLDKYMQF